LPSAGTQTTAPSGDTVKTQVQVVASGLDTPWSIDFAPDGRIFLTERLGRVRVIKDGALQAPAGATLPVAERGESGLLGLALDPQFAQNGYVYLAYTYTGGGGLRNRLVRLHDDPATGTGTQDRVLADGLLGGTNHDGGRVKFGPDGKLYWTMGETFNGPLAQDLQSLSGKILRYNPDGSIPADNPFPGSPIYSYGHRNPQGLAWQPGTGRLYETEHGPSGEKGCCQDEVNLIEPGQNYGWPVISGAETRAGMVAPILQSGTSTTWAPSGAAFVSAGPWAGSFLFAALRGEALYRVILDPSRPRGVVDLERWFYQSYGRLRDVAVGPDGGIYILTSNRDGRGSPRSGDDKVLKLTLTP
jgi:glucose/arabinose dehydrogenase